MEDYKIRLKNEYDELDDRLGKLICFLKKEDNKKLPNYKILKKQKKVMFKYWLILRKRIATEIK